MPLEGLAEKLSFKMISTIYVDKFVEKMDATTGFLGAP
jgi:hypothetical protein